MSATLIVTLLTIFGPSAINLITGLIEKINTNGEVTAAEWATLTESLNQTATDRMKAQLTAAGIALDSPQAVALLALVK